METTATTSLTDALPSKKRRNPGSSNYRGFVLCLHDTSYLFLATASIAYAVTKIKYSQNLSKILFYRKLFYSPAKKEKTLLSWYLVESFSLHIYTHIYKNIYKNNTNNHFSISNISYIKSRIKMFVSVTLLCNRYFPIQTYRYFPKISTHTENVLSSFHA